MGHDAFEHVALFHDGPRELAEQIDGWTPRISPTDAVLVSLDEAAGDAVCEVLTAHGHQVARFEADVRYARPAGAMRMVHDFTQQALRREATKVWSIGRIDFSNDDGRWARYEAAVDDVLGHLPFAGICTYDAATMSDRVLETAQRTHRDLHRDGDTAPSPTYGTAGLERLGAPWIPATRPAVDLAADDVSACRTAVGRLGRAVGLSDGRLLDLQVVVSELATNAVTHGATPASVRAWEDDERVVVQVLDVGPGLDDPWPDLRPPSPDTVGGFGLWIVGQLADHVAIERLGAGTTSVAAVFEGASAAAAEPAAPSR